jgi:UDP-glucose 4-epimerase
VALRYFNVYGSRMNVRGPHTEVLVRWMERIERGDPPLIDGDGMQVMDFVHVTDVARANVLAATAPSSEPVFNVGSGRALTLNDLAATLLRAMGSDLLVHHGPPRAVNSARRRVADPTLAERGLGFRVRVPLDDGLRDLVAWWREPDHGARASRGVNARGVGPS